MKKWQLRGFRDPVASEQILQAGLDSFHRYAHLDNNYFPHDEKNIYRLNRVKPIRPERYFPLKRQSLVCGRCHAI